MEPELLERIKLAMGQCCDNSDGRTFYDLDFLNKMALSVYDMLTEKYKITEKEAQDAKGITR